MKHYKATLDNIILAGKDLYNFLEKNSHMIKISSHLCNRLMRFMKLANGLFAKFLSTTFIKAI